MLSIFATTDLIPAIRQIIQTEHRLDELVQARPNFPTPAPSQPPPKGEGKESPLLERGLGEAVGVSFLIDERGIVLPPDWHNQSPPYLFANPLPFDAAHLLGLVFAKLGNLEKSYVYLQKNTAFWQEIVLSDQLRQGYEINLYKADKIVSPENAKPLSADGQAASFDEYRSLHNRAVIRHYGVVSEEIRYAEIKEFYQNALSAAPNDEYRAFTAKHLATLLTDAGELTEAETLLEESIGQALSEDAEYSLKHALTQVWLKQLTVPYNEKLLLKLKDALWETLQYFEKNNLKVEAGLLWIDASHVANISNSFSEALGYATKAVQIFEAEDIPELLGHAWLRKGTLLYTWAQNGNPQFYKSALDAYQSALKIYRKDVAPDVFADIHHNLAVLYSEMPDENKKRGIWAAVSASSFKEALGYYSKETFPYEYAMICNNYGNALMKYPPAAKSDNFARALEYFNEALSIRTAEHYPYERALTLLNYIEANWNAGNEEDDFNEQRYEDMVAKAQEIKMLVSEDSLLSEADKHLTHLAQLKQVTGVN
jgi:tetratricopeptide (TPR) repeat protein